MVDPRQAMLDPQFWKAAQDEAMKANTELKAQLAEAKRELCAEQAEHTREVLLRAVTQCKLTAAEARLKAVHIALTDAGAPEGTSAKALNDDDIIERISLWKYTQDGVVEILESRETELRAALVEIRGRKPQVCSEYEHDACVHVGCEASYAAFVIADAALQDAPDADKEKK